MCSALPTWCPWAFPTTTRRDCQSCQSCWLRHARFQHQSCSQTTDRGYWFGNKIGCAHAYKIKKWCPSQRTAAGQCWERLFDYSKFEAMKSVSGWDAVRCDEHQFHKIKVSTWPVFELSSFDQWLEQRIKLTQTFALSCLLHCKRKPGCLNRLLACLWLSYMAFA